MENDSVDRYVFGFGPMSHFFNYCHWLIFAGLFAVCITEVVTYWQFYPDFKRMLPYATVYVLSPSFLVLYLFVRIAFYRMAYKATVDTNERTITLWLFFTKSPVLLNFEKIRAVRITWCPAIHMHGGAKYRLGFLDRHFFTLLRLNDIDREWKGLATFGRKHWE